MLSTCIMQSHPGHVSLRTADFYVYMAGQAVYQLNKHCGILQLYLVGVELMQVDPHEIGGSSTGASSLLSCMTTHVTVFPSALSVPFRVTHTSKRADI